MSIWDRVKRITPKVRTQHEQQLADTVVTYRCRVCGWKIPMISYVDKGRCRCGNHSWVPVDNAD